MNEVRHILGISGGKDSAALAIYLNELYFYWNYYYFYFSSYLFNPNDPWEASSKKGIYSLPLIEFFMLFYNDLSLSFFFLEDFTECVFSIF